MEETYWKGINVWEVITSECHNKVLHPEFGTRINGGKWEYMSEIEVLSKDRYPVNVSVWQKGDVGLATTWTVGLPGLEGERYRLVERGKTGYWIQVRTTLENSNIASIVRTALHGSLGNSPIIMPQTTASHITVIFWGGDTPFSPVDLCNLIGRAINANNLVVEQNPILQSGITQYEYSMLLAVDVGSSSLQSYLRNYRETFDSLFAKGFIRKGLFITGSPVLTKKGKLALLRSSRVKQG